VELEAEVAKLKEENDELQRKQVITKPCLSITVAHTLHSFLIVRLMFYRQGSWKCKRIR